MIESLFPAVGKPSDRWPWPEFNPKRFRIDAGGLGTLSERETKGVSGMGGWYDS